MDAILGGIAGGLLGVVATTIGVLLARHFSVREEHSQERRNCRRVVAMVVLEIESQREFLESDQPISLMSDTAFQLLRTTFFLADIPPQVAYDLLNLYELFGRINDKIEHQRQGVLANVSASENRKIGVENIRKDIDMLRREAISAVDKRLLPLKAVARIDTGK